MSTKKTTIVIILLVILVAAAILAYSWYTKKASVSTTETSTAPTSGLGSQLYQQTGAPAASPLQNTNPFDKVKTNPFE